MSVSRHEHATPSATGGDGVRVVRERSPLSVATVMMMLAAVVVAAGIASLLFSSHTPPAQRSAMTRAGNAGTAPADATSAQARRTAPPSPSTAPVRTPQHHASLQTMPVAPDPDDQPSGDPDDLATYLSPTAPAPTMTEVIQALHDSGDHTGIGAFNPPGTSPPLVGLAVPADFELPPGYVRHHQVTDEGEPLEPILMFSPDGAFVDASGRPITIPDDRVVPADMAPPGLPIREITLPPAGERQP